MSHEAFAVHEDEAVAVGRRVAPLVARWCFSREDCEQEARVVLLHLIDRPEWVNLRAPDRAKYMYVAVRRGCLRAARPSSLNPADRWLEKQVDPRDPLAVVELEDLISSCEDEPVRLYLRCRVTDGCGRDETMDLCGFSKRDFYAVRDRAAHWLLSQLEGT